MSNILIIILFSLFPFNLFGNTLDDLVLRNGIYYKKFYDTPYTGKVEVGGYPYQTGVITSGRKEGEWLEYWGSGQLNKRSNYINGKLNGKTIWYHQNGNFWSITDYKDDVRNGKILVFNVYGILIQDLTFKNGYKHGLNIDYNKDYNIDMKYSGLYKMNKKIAELSKKLIKQKTHPFLKK